MREYSKDEKEYKAYVQSLKNSVLTAFYTPEPVVTAMQESLQVPGIRPGRFLDPSAGTGMFISGLKGVPEVHCFEKDRLTGRILSSLYPESRVTIDGFQSIQPYYNNYFDMVSSNIPFGNTRVYDRDFDRSEDVVRKSSLAAVHNYFFLKGMDTLHEGGILAYITTSGVMDSPQNRPVREWLVNHANLVSAIRLPDNTFKRNAGTEVTSDIIFLQKRDHITDLEQDWVHLDTDENGIRMNSYFVQHPEMILGDMVMESTRFGPDSACKAREGEDLSEQLANAIQFLQAEIKPYELEELDEEEDRSIPADPTVKNFSYTIADGQVYYRENSLMHPVEVSVTAENRIRGMIELRECTRRLIEYQTEGYPDEDIAAEQQKLNALYDNFTAKYGLLNSRGNKLAFSEDSSYCLLCSLEVLDEQGNL